MFFWKSPTTFPWTSFNMGFSLQACWDNVQLSWLQQLCFQSCLFIYVFNECCEKCYDFQVLIIHTWWYICIISVLGTSHVCQRFLYFPFIPPHKWKMEFKEVEGSSCINLFFGLHMSKLLCNTRIHMNIALSMWLIIDTYIATASINMILKWLLKYCT